MAEVIRNLYKAAGLFTCRHPAHRRFGYEVSPYHIFCVKKCMPLLQSMRGYPSGCVEFLWRCRTFEKGQACPRGFKHVGRGCFSCKQYHEDKVTFSPETTLQNGGLPIFIDRLREYQGWLSEMDGKLIEFVGTAESIMPHLAMYVESNRYSVEMDGFYASFAEGHIGRDTFADRLYLKLSTSQVERHRIAPGDRVECEAYFTESRGRIILRKPRKIEVARCGGRADISFSRALVGRATGKIIAGDIEYCTGCPFVSLVDIENNNRRTPTFYRRFYCLRGVDDSENCPVRLSGLLPPPDKAENSPKRF